MSDDELPPRTGRGPPITVTVVRSATLQPRAMKSARAVDVDDAAFSSVAARSRRPTGLWSLMSRGRGGSGWRPASASYADPTSSPFRWLPRLGT
jgi:hypothetical protein